MAGAEKLLGAGDMLYLSGEMSQPQRIQSAFISENEVKKVVKYIIENNREIVPNEIGIGEKDQATVANGSILSMSLSGGDEDVDDELYEEAKQAVIEAGKASTSYLQRKLRVGYARAARLIDILEEKGVIGPGDGAKPREVMGASTPTEASEEEPTV
jgi:S-DNA-T family DNA segregation ATPase FtsK/SpoIIIE